MKIYEEVWSVEEPGRVGQVASITPNREAFRVDWYDGAVSVEIASEEHIAWEKVAS